MKYQSLLTALAVCCLVPRPVAAADDVFDSNGVRIWDVTEGKGEPVVLIHGWMGDSSMWGRDGSGNTKLNTKDADGFQLIALDCRGHGQSEKPHDPEKYGPEMAADVVRLLDHPQLEKAHLIGYSSGAFIVGNVPRPTPRASAASSTPGKPPSSRRRNRRPTLPKSRSSPGRWTRAKTWGPTSLR
jgi:pimeloyl-ACP methyl ester carboxylesterase